jgi:hypothetical protein
MLLVVLIQLLLSSCVGDGDQAVQADGVEASILVLVVEERAPRGGVVDSIAAIADGVRVVQCHGLEPTD